MQFVFTLKKKKNPVFVFTTSLFLTKVVVLLIWGWSPHLESHIPKGSGCEMKMEIGRHWSRMKGGRSNCLRESVNQSSFVSLVSLDKRE